MKVYCKDTVFCHVTNSVLEILTHNPNMFNEHNFIQLELSNYTDPLEDNNSEDNSASYIGKNSFRTLGMFEVKELLMCFCCIAGFTFCNWQLF